jgi:hypothetical protein
MKSSKIVSYNKKNKHIWYVYELVTITISEYVIKVKKGKNHPINYIYIYRLLEEMMIGANAKVAMPCL